MRPYHLVLHILIVVSAGCSASELDAPAITYSACHPIVVVPDAQATAEERASVAQALELWNRLGATQLTLDEVAGAEHLPVVFDDAAASFHGLYDAQLGVVYVNHTQIDDHARSVVIAHELGHAMGLPHISSRASVMQPGNLSTEPLALDASALTCD